MLSADVADKGFVLLCCGRPESDCSIKTVDEVRRAQPHGIPSVQPRASRVRRTTTLMQHPPVSRAQEELLSVQMQSGAL